MRLALSIIMAWFALSIPMGMLVGKWLGWMDRIRDREARETWDACLWPGGKP